MDLEYENGLRLCSFFKNNFNCSEKCNTKKYCSNCCDFYYINLKQIKKLCDSEKLKDSHCFQLLFGFKKGSFKSEDKLFNFRNYHITYNQWSTLLSFLENGIKYLKILPNEKILQLTETCNKFGGIIYFDKQFKLYLNELNKPNLNKIKKPDEDINNIYKWKIVLDHDLTNFYKNFTDYNYSGHSEKITSITTVFYFKKLV
tara:strand:+ start:239 stop:841 length:603 start_codon:yes stop_codon:yes gene_type:complete